MVIIGGGFAGLAAAYELRRASETTDVLLLESGNRLGGKVTTVAHERGVCEEGPNAMLSPDGALKELIDLSGVDLLEADDSAKRRYLCHSGRLIEISPNPLQLYRKGALSLRGTLRMLCEQFIGPRECKHGNHASAQWGDESVHLFLKRRFGAELADRFGAPMVSGIFAGNPKSLSLQSCFPKLASLEEEHGSVIKGLKAIRSEGRQQPRLYSPRAGMQGIPDGLAKRNDFEVRTDAKVTGLRPDGEKWMVDTAGQEPIAADAVILATPAAVTSQLLSSLCSGAAALLRKISSPHLAVINLLYEGADTTKAPRAFGALHSQDGQSELLGVLHESHIFPDRQPDGSLQLRVMLGGALRPEMGSYADSDLIEAAARELQRLHGFTAQPLIMGIRRWNSAIPQYELGHARLIKDALAAINDSHMSPLELAGNYLQGVSLSDTATSGRHAGQKILDLLGS